MNRLLLPALLLLAAPIARADLDVLLRSGDSVTGTLSPGTEHETFRFVVPKDAAISFSAKGVKRKSPPAAAPAVTFEVFDPDGNEIGGARVVVKGTGAKVTKLLAPKSGEYRVVVSGSGAEGDYKAALAWTSRKSFPIASATPPLATQTFAFAAEMGSSATLKVTAGRGNALPRMTEVRDALDAIVAPMTPPTDAAAKTHTAKIASLAAGGDLVLVVTDAGGGSPFTGSIVLKTPKSKKRKLALGGSAIPPLAGGGVAAVFGPDGGVLEADAVPAIEGASVVIPAGALGKPTAIVAGVATVLDVGIAGLAAAGPAVFFGPEGLTFLSGLRATVVVPYDDGAHPGGAGLRVFTRAADGTVTEITPVTVDPVAHTLSVATSHFSAFQAFGPIPLPLEKVRLTATSGLDGDRFGISCAVSGPRLVVGADIGQTTGASIHDTGVAHVFFNGVDGWTEETELASPSAAAGDRFGESVDIDGDLVVVSVRQSAQFATDGGAAAVFVRSGSNWNFDDWLKSPAPFVGEHFGFSVALSAETAVVGSTQSEDSLGATKGAVFVFNRGTGSWVREATIIPADAIVGGAVGTSVAIDGDTLAFGAASLADGGGAVWIYRRMAGEWCFEQRLQADAPVDGDWFGRNSISISGDTIAVGAPRSFQAGTPNPQVYVFRQAGVTWSKEAVFSGPANSEFGISVALSDDTLFAGARRADGAGGNDSGLAYRSRRTGPSWTAPTIFEPASPGPSRLFGQSVAFDGVTLVVGALGFSNDRGAVYVFAP